MPPVETPRPPGDAYPDALLADGVVKTYGGRRVLDGLSLRARTAQVTAVLGRNGAGKTTFVECCEGLRRPDGGRLRVLGLDPAADGARLRERVGVMLQDGGGLPTGASAGAVLRHMARLYRSPRDVAELCDLLGLGDVARTPVRRLSGGQRQRLALAVALVGDPELVFLDEPTAGMDLQARRSVCDVIRALRDRGVAVVLTTHLMDEVEQLADRVVVVDAGRSVRAGTVAELTAAGARLTFSADGLDGVGLAAALGPEVEVAAGRRVVVRRRDGGDLPPQVLATVMTWCAGQGVTPHDVTLQRPALHDVVMELTGGPS